MNKHKIMLSIGDEHYFGESSDVQVAAIKAATEAMRLGNFTAGRARTEGQWRILAEIKCCGSTAGGDFVCGTRESLDASYVAERYEPADPWSTPGTAARRGAAYAW